MKYANFKKVINKGAFKHPKKLPKSFKATQQRMPRGRPKKRNDIMTKARATTGRRHGQPQGGSTGNHRAAAGNASRDGGQDREGMWERGG